MKKLDQSEPNTYKMTTANGSRRKEAYLSFILSAVLLIAAVFNYGDRRLELVVFDILAALLLAVLGAAELRCGKGRVTNIIGASSVVLLVIYGAAVLLMHVL